jgi:hypothetical protein
MGIMNNNDGTQEFPFRVTQRGVKDVTTFSSSMNTRPMPSLATLMTWGLMFSGRLPSFRAVEPLENVPIAAVPRYLRCSER